MSSAPAVPSAADLAAAKAAQESKDAQTVSSVNAKIAALFSSKYPKAAVDPSNDDVVANSMMKEDVVAHGNAFVGPAPGQVSLVARVRHRGVRLGQGRAGGRQNPEEGDQQELSRRDERGCCWWTRDAVLWDLRSEAGIPLGVWTFNISPSAISESPREGG